ncbi:GAF domain-containing protein [Anabaena sp. UHCC 0204]|uniref:GAF domain-containing protein n=1 Tax=Anabaena sp. UHCC 0204 TaxID=2590009 RepID=UPI0014476297|nr:GAF domain-containing protein [Anabaena sp. UHCC 0204]MTJ09837.1 GAF domain-containing protein [Anabaena sp. UHCC 0204]
MNNDLNYHIKNNTNELTSQARQEKLLLDMVLRIRASQDLETILNTAVQEIRQLLAADRVIIYRLEPNWSGEVLFEAVTELEQPILHQTIWDECFEQSWLESIGQSLMPKMMPKAIANIYHTGFSDFDLNALDKFQIKANLVVPIYVNHQIWGFLITHHSQSSWNWQPSEIRFLEQLSVNIAIAIQQATLLEKVRQNNQELELQINQRTTLLENTNFQLLAELVERKKVETELKATQTKLAGILDVADDAIICIDTAQKITLFNQGATRIFGFTASEIIGKSLDVLIPKRFVTVHCQHIQRFISCADVARPMGYRNRDLFALRKDGTEFPADASISKWNTGNEVILTIILRDITKSKQVEIELRKSQRLLAKAQKVAKIGSWDFDLITQKMTWTEELFQILNRDLALPEPNYEENLQIYHIDDRQKLHAAWQRAMILGESYHLVLRIPLFDSKINYIEAIGHAEIRDSKVVRLYGTCQDITERIQADITLQKELNKALLLKNLTDQIRETLNPDEILQTAVQQISQAFGVNRCLIHSYMTEPVVNVPLVAEYISGNYESIFKLHVTIPAIGNPHIEQLLKQETAIASDNVYADPLLESAESICRQINLKSMLSVATFYQGKPNGLIGLHQCDRYRHWTEEEVEMMEAVAAQLGIAIVQAQLLEQEKTRRQELSNQNADLVHAKQEAEAANKAKGEFLANMSHEIRTPMNAVLGFTELLASTITDNPAKEYIEAISSSGKILLALINDILDLSKIEAGKLQIHFEPVDLRLLLQDIKIVFSQTANSKGIKLETEIDHHLPTIIQIDEVRLRQILLNIVGNAIKFTDQGYVKIIVNLCNQNIYDRETTCLEITVEDTGIGIAPSDQEKIFRAFTQSNSQSNRKYGGTGLGLTITQRLVQMMAGTIELQSQLGKGSKFILRFSQLAISNPLTITKSTIREDENLDQFPSLIILVADDVQSNLDLIGSYFADTSHQLIFAHDGYQAIQLAQIYNPDLILLDLRMPKMDGRETSQFLKNNQQLQNIPIIVLTASPQQSDKIELQALCQGFLRKPVSRRELVTALKKVLKWDSYVTENQENLTEKSSPHHLTPYFQPEEIVMVSDLFIKISQEANTNWNKLRKTLTIRDLELFIERLNNWGQEHQCQLLIDYANTISKHLDNFDWDQIPASVEQFAVVQAEIKHYLAE